MDIKQEITEILDSGISMSSIATSLGYSPTVLSLWKTDKYSGDNSALEKALAAYVKNFKIKTTQRKYNPSFCDISNSRRVFATVKIAHLDKKMALLVSDSGFGKTASLKEYKTRNPGTIFIEVDHTYNPKRLFKEIHKALGRSGKGLLEDIYTDCIESLSGTDRLLIIDEAELLNHKAIELIRRLHDKSGCGIVLSGMPKLLENIRGIRSEFAQLFTRIGASMKLKPLTKEDIELIVKKTIPDISSESIKEFFTQCKSNGRTLSMLIYNVIRAVDDRSTEITPQIIARAATMLEV